MAATKPFVNAISYHAWNKDRTQLAIATNDDEFELWNTEGEDPANWKKTSTYAEHGGFVSCIDWCPSTNDIVTCGHDRNAYVWSQDDKKEWKPTLVILRINRAATSVRWSPSGKKFAVTSGAKCVPVCHYEESNHWWISKMIKKHKSTVLCMDWSPSSKMIVTGSCDKVCRVFSAYIAGLDDDADSGLGFDAENKFGTPLMEFPQAKSWVNAVSWSPVGSIISFAGHGSTLGFADLKSKEVNQLSCTGLPFLDIKFVDEKTLIGVGFDMNPIVFTGTGIDWKQTKKLDEEKGAKKKADTSARARFQAADKRGKSFGDTSSSGSLKTKHQNIITNFQIVPGGITTSGLDGRVLFWKL